MKGEPYKAPRKGKQQIGIMGMVPNTKNMIHLSTQVAEKWGVNEKKMGGETDTMGPGRKSNTQQKTSRRMGSE